jgi:hypothetical protein
MNSKRIVFISSYPRWLHQFGYEIHHLTIRLVSAYFVEFSAVNFRRKHLILFFTVQTNKTNKHSSKFFRRNCYKPMQKGYKPWNVTSFIVSIRDALFCWLLSNRCWYSKHFRNIKILIIYRQRTSMNLTKPLKPHLVYKISKNSVRTSKKTSHFTITKIN